MTEKDQEKTFLNHKKLNTSKFLVNRKFAL